MVAHNRHYFEARSVAAPRPVLQTGRNSPRYLGIDQGEERRGEEEEGEGGEEELMQVR